MTEQEIRPWVQALNTAIRIVPKALRSVDALWKNPRVRVAAGTSWQQSQRRVHPHG